METPKPSTTFFEQSRSSLSTAVGCGGTTAAASQRDKGGAVHSTPNSHVVSGNGGRKIKLTFKPAADVLGAVLMPPDFRP